MKKNVLLIVMLMSMFFFNINVNAEPAAELARASVSSEADLYNSLKAKYDEGLPSYSVNSSDLIVVYGYSECTASSGTCTFNYQGNVGDNIETLLAKSVFCSNSESYLRYSTPTSPIADYRVKYSESVNDTMYWSEVYTVACVTDNSGENIVDLNNSGNIDNNNDNISGDGGDAIIDDGNSDYNSSSTEESPETGVETYYIILGLIAIISYGFMVVAKKYNLFKKIWFY